MAVDFIEGWDYYSNSERSVNGWTNLGGGGIGITTAAVRNGTRGYSLVSNGGQDHYGMSNATTRILGFALRVQSKNNNGATYGIFIGLADGATTQMTLAVSNTGALAIHRTVSLGISSSAAVAVSSNLLSDGVWYYVEIVHTCHASTGTLEVYVNGSKTGWIDYTGNTMQTANAYTNAIRMGASTGMSYDLDDMYCVSGTGGTTTTRLGDSVVLGRLMSTGNGTHADSTPSTGSDRGAMVDEVPPNGDTDYNTFTAAGQKDTYTKAALGITGTVKAVQVKNYTKKTDAGACEATPQVLISGTLYSGTTRAVGMTTYGYEFASDLWELSPATSAAWTVSEIDNAEVGVKRVT